MTNESSVVREDVYASRIQWPAWLSWRPTSLHLLSTAEDKLHKRCTSHIDTFFVVNELKKYVIRTICAKNPNTNADNKEVYDSRLPIVLVHGFGGGNALWIKNIDALAIHRRVYAMDLLGFARSSRLEFPKVPLETEEVYVNSFEHWRNVLGLEKFILIGHSFGGYLAAAYALQHPQRIQHLFLVDPWGFPCESVKIPVKSAFLRNVMPKLFSSPLGIMRATGWLGPHLLRRVRQDFIGVFQHQPRLQIGQEIPIPPGKPEGDSVADESIFSTEVIYDYMYHCNARKPTGENAFNSLCNNDWWAAMPMLPRISNLPVDMPITFIYGSRTWLDISTGYQAKGLRPASYVDVQVLNMGGHSAYAECAYDFNRIVNLVCSRIDQELPFQPES